MTNVHRALQKTAMEYGFKRLTSIQAALEP